MGDIAYVASCVMDLSFEVDQFPQPGETIVTDQFHTGYGGKGANQAVAAAKTGANVRVTGAVGNDDFGRGTVENFQSHGINTEQLYEMSETGTGLASINIDSDGENQIIVAPRANKELSENHISEISDAWFDVSVLAGVNEIPEETLIAAFRRARRIDSAETVLNAAPAEPLPDELWGLVDCLIVNESEAEFYLDKEINSGDLEPPVRELLGKGPKRVILTLGEHGSVFADENRFIHQPAPAVEAVDTTGAGDAFVGAYLSARARAVEPDEALRQANNYAAESVKHKGTQKSFPDRN